MPIAAYPPTLPAPQQGWAFVLRERAVRSSLPGNPQARRRFSDALQDVSSATWTYTPDEMAVWWPWFRTTLKDGQLRFSAATPGAGGTVARTMRYRPETLQVTPLGGGIARVTAQLEVRGR